MIANTTIRLGLCTMAAGLLATTAHAQSFNFTGAIQTWVVPTTGSYVISATGAKGGDRILTGRIGGLGATVSAKFVLSAGTSLNLVVAGQGGSAQFGGSGGGASWVFVTGDSLPLLVAGGGGGASINPTENSTGIGGSGGAALVADAGGGAGWLADGAGTGGGKSRPSFAGGVGTSGNPSGGFGGGGAAFSAGGGGSGFTGGRGGYIFDSGRAGTSYVSASASDAVFGTGSNVGSISISAVPEPASWAMLIAGFGLVGGAVRARRLRLARA